LKKPEETSVQVERKAKVIKEGKENLMSWFISYPVLAILFIFCKRF